jgi:hypothetical protein
MRHRFTGLRWAVVGGIASALVLAATAAANHAGTFNLGHYNSTPAMENNGLDCSATSNPCLDVTNSTAPTVGPPAPAIRGRHSPTSGQGVGVWGISESPDGHGVLGVHTAATGLGAGVNGQTNSTATAAPGVRGSADGAGTSAMGVLGVSQNGIGVAAVGGSLGLYAQGPQAAYFNGNVFVNGTLSKSAGSFRIDHPLDRTKYLQHSFVESPDMMNVYNGNVRTDRRGFATVRLPGYFHALNRSFRYQLTVLGRSFARAVVWQKITGSNRFRIRTDRPEVEVSWQVTGIRKDAYANAHRIQPEIAKAAVGDTTAVSPRLLHRLGAAR